MNTEMEKRKMPTLTPRLQKKKFIFGVTLIILLISLRKNLTINVSVESIISNQQLFLNLLKSPNNLKENDLGEASLPITYPIIVSSPVPETKSIQYQYLGKLDILEKRNGRIYFVVPNVGRLISYGIHLPNIQMEQKMMRDRARTLDEITLASNISDMQLAEEMTKTSSNSHIQMQQQQQQQPPLYPSIHPYFYCYRNVQGSYMTLEYLETRYPDLVEIVNIGPSYLKAIGEGGHDILVLRLTNKQTSNGNHTSNTTKPPLFVLCGLHSRELSPTEACARFAEDILDQYGKHADKTWILDYTEIHMILQSNPDGREDEELQLALNPNALYLRRKNMHACDTCVFPCLFDNGSRFGVDLNRNFPHSAWGSTGITGRCDTAYPGTGPASEPETQAITKYVESILQQRTKVSANTATFNSTDGKLNHRHEEEKKSQQGVFIDVHSYGEDFFWPYAYSESALSPFDQELRILAEKFSSLTYPKYSSNNEVYLTSGDTTDWAHEATGIAAYTVEIGTEFYQRCNYFENFIEQNVKRVLLYAARVAVSPYSLPKGPEVVSMGLSSNTLTSNDNLRVSVSLSSAQSPSNANYEITSIHIFIDDHPYDASSSEFSIIQLKNSTDSYSDLKIQVFSVPMFNIPVGEHVLYIQANGEGMFGPAYSAFFEIVPIPSAVRSADGK